MSVNNGKNMKIFEFITMVSIGVFLVFILVKFLYF
jgi:hypothetical protein